MNPKTLAEYYAQQGSTLPSIGERSTLANQFGIQNYTGTTQQNNQLLSQLLTVTPPSTYTPTNPVAPTGPINLASVPDSVPTPPASTVVPTPVATETLTLQPVPTTTVQQDPLLARSNTLQQEITALEQSIANRGAERNQLLGNLESDGTVVSVFDQMRQLNTLKDELNRAQTAEVSIPLTTQNRLRGSRATLTEVGNASAAQLEQNALQQLTATANVEAQTNAINTNIAIVDSFLKAKQDQEDFVYAQKQKELENVQKVYGDIMTSQQALALEERKQQNAIELENNKFKNESLTKAADAALKAGGDPAAIARGVQNGSVADLYGIAGNATNSTTTNTKTGVNLNLVDSISLIDRMLKNEGGLGANVGTTQVGRGIRGSATGLGNINAFRTDFQKLVADETLRKFLELKGQGATFGAMTESEWNLLERAALDLGSIQGKEGRSNLTPEVFKERLNTVQNGIKKLFIKNNMSDADYSNLGLQYSQNTEEINNVFNDIKSRAATTAPTSSFENELSGGSVSTSSPVIGFIAEQEGFRPQAYRDSAGVWTIGYGNTQINGRPVQPGDTVTQEQANQLLAQDVARHSTFKSGVTAQLTPNQEAALTSFEYNLGPAVWQQPTGQKILAAVNTGDYSTAGNLMLRFSNAKDPATGVLRPLEGLLNRRKREAELLFA